MQTSERLSLKQIQAFLESSGEVEFEGQNREEVYGWVNQTLRQQQFEGLKRSQRGLVRGYVEKMTGLSRAQTTRLVTMYLGGDEVKPQAYRRRRFPQRYTREDIALLAGLEAAHETLSGPATKKLLQRACYNFGDRRYQNLACISVAQLCPLRASPAYRERRIQYQTTKPTPVSIGERRKPEPRGRPGYLRIDTVHQGDQDGVKGVYHINAVDEVTQWEVVGKPRQSDGADRLPLVGYGGRKPYQERRPSRRVAPLPPPGSSFNEKMLLVANRLSLSPLGTLVDACIQCDQLIPLPPPHQPHVLFCLPSTR